MITIFTSKTQQLGQRGEDEAVVFLMKHGFKIVERNVHSRNGEIDIIAKKKRIYYFFEVKAGKQGSWFNPADNLTRDKLKKFHKAVEYYRFKHRFKEYKVQGMLVWLHYDEKIPPVIEIIDLS
ncbi:MAG: YraN family protein [Candidatus Paceibacterota bacterium]